MSVEAKNKPVLPEQQSPREGLYKVPAQKVKKNQVAPAATAEDRVCSICLDAFDLYSLTLNCLKDHAFHSACIGEWLFDQGKTTCPDCVRPIGEKERDMLFRITNMIDRQKIIDSHPLVKCIPVAE